MANPPGTRAGGPAASLAAETDRLMACIHCGFCLDACPTYTRAGDESDSPRGRIYLMRAVAEGRIPADSAAFRLHLDRCLGCRACEPVCPSGVEYGFLLERGRDAIANAGGIPLLERMLLATFGSPVLNTIAGFLARLVRGSGLAGLIRRVAPARFARLRIAAAMLEASRPWNGPQAPQGGNSAGGDAPGGDVTGGGAPDGGRGGQRVTVFDGCVQKTLFSRVNDATADVLRYNGHTIVNVGGQRCCGALHAHAGALAGARSLARRNLDAFAPFVSGADEDRVDAIIVNAAGCGAMMKQYGALFEGQPEHELASAVAERVRDSAMFLAEHGVRPGRPVALKVAWDSPCHLVHGQRAGDAPLEMLRAAVPGLEVIPVPHADECCGGAGIHGLTHASDSQGILADKVAEVRSVGADMAVTANPGCIMQIGAGLRLSGDRTPVVHPIEVVGWSCRP